MNRNLSFVILLVAATLCVTNAWALMTSSIGTPTSIVTRSSTPAETSAPAPAHAPAAAGAVQRAATLSPTVPPEPAVAVPAPATTATVRALADAATLTAEMPLVVGRAEKLAKDPKNPVLQEDYKNALLKITENEKQALVDKLVVATDEYLANPTTITMNALEATQIQLSSAESETSGNVAAANSEEKSVNEAASPEEHESPVDSSNQGSTEKS